MAGYFSYHRILHLERMFHDGSVDVRETLMIIIRLQIRYSQFQFYSTDALEDLAKRLNISVVLDVFKDYEAAICTYFSHICFMELPRDDVEHLKCLGRKLTMSR